MDLGLDVSRRDGVAVLTARGDIDLGSAHGVRELALRQIISGDRALVVDLSDVEFIDSVGLGLLVAVLKRARSLGGDVALVVTRDRVRKPFEMTGLTGIFAIHDNLDAAVAASRVAAGE